jgi:hypothetical protein
MSAMGEAFAGLRNVLLMQENIERLEKNFDKLSGDLIRTRDYAASIEQRVARVEGVVEGYGRAMAAQPRLPKD